ncbi:CoA pyrophosphatase [Rudaea sp.]|uniref:CoA pyrophosphatase n=1 Tax=Rudaea sp. TaxID=2136325 RepID=UPI002ED6A717
MTIPVSVSDLRERVLHSVRPLDAEPGGQGWNHDDMRLLIGAGPRRPAAVLVALVDRGDALHVLLTRRTDSLSNHAGQVSFPGGAIDPGDTDAVAAALRETREEIGIDIGLVEPIGYLDTFETISSYRITPVVAWLDPGYLAVPNPYEVAEVFEVPLAHFLDPTKKHTVRMKFQGHEREIHEFFYAGQRIWGATAAMLLDFVQRLEAAAT